MYPIRYHSDELVTMSTLERNKTSPPLVKDKPLVKQGILPNKHKEALENLHGKRLVEKEKVDAILAAQVRKELLYACMVG